MRSFLKSLRVAIVHDCLLELGGAERVLNELLEIFPQADLYTSLFAPRLRQQLPCKHRVFSLKPNLWQLGTYWSSLIKPALSLYWMWLDFSSYDLVISSSHSFSSKSIKVKQRTVHISYIHTPPKYLYGEFNEMSWTRRFPYNVLLQPLFSVMRRYDFNSAQQPKALLTNSKTVQQRIQKYYGRQSLVIHPPVSLRGKIADNQKKLYFLFHSRLVRQKGAELVVRCFTKTGDALVIVGEGPESKHLRQIAGPNCQFLGRVTDEAMGAVYSKARALIFCGIDEDFGLVMAESLAAGVPVIAYKSPATEEIITNPKLGLLFAQYSTASLEQAVRKFNNQHYNWKEIVTYGKRFESKKFRQKLLSLVLSYFPR